MPPKECKQVKVELANLHGHLIRLQCHLEQEEITNPWYSAMRALNIPDGAFDQYLQALKQLEAKTTIKGHVQKLRRMLVWKFSKEEVASLLDRVERLKTLIGTALELDHL